MRAIPHARRDGHDRTADQPGHDAGECPFHAGDDDDGPRPLQEGEFAEDPMDARDSDVIRPGRTAAQELRRHRGFFRHRQVRSAGADHRHQPPAPQASRRHPIAQPGRRVIPHDGKAALHELGRDRIQAGQQRQLPRPYEPLDEPDDLDGGFAFAEDDLGEPPPQAPVRVQPGES